MAVKETCKCRNFLNLHNFLFCFFFFFFWSCFCFFVLFCFVLFLFLFLFFVFFFRYLDDVALHHLVDALCRLSSTSMEQAQSNKVTKKFNGTITQSKLEEKINLSAFPLNPKELHTH